MTQSLPPKYDPNTGLTSCDDPAWLLTLPLGTHTFLHTMEGVVIGEAHLMYALYPKESIEKIQWKPEDVTEAAAIGPKVPPLVRVYGIPGCPACEQMYSRFKKTRYRVKKVTLDDDHMERITKIARKFGLFYAADHILNLKVTLTMNGGSLPLVSKGLEVLSL